MAMTKEQWDQVEEEMKGSYGRVQLSLDGRTLSLEKRLIAENKLAILVFIDGSYSLGWGWLDGKHFDPFVQKVWRKRTRSIHKPSEKARIIKSLGKRLARETFPNLDKKLEFWAPDFTTASSMRRALQKNKEIELIHIGFKAEAI